MREIENMRGLEKRREIEEKGNIRLNQRESFQKWERNGKYV